MSPKEAVDLLERATATLECGRKEHLAVMNALAVLKVLTEKSCVESETEDGE